MYEIARTQGLMTCHAKDCTDRMPTLKEAERHVRDTGHMVKVEYTIYRKDESRRGGMVGRL